MFTIVTTGYFLRRARKFLQKQPDLRQRFAQVVDDLRQDPFAAHLAYHRLGGKLKNFQAVSVTFEYRIILTLEVTEEVILLDIGSHGKVYRSYLYGRGVAYYVRQHLASWRLYHFHDTSFSFPMKKTGDVNDNRYLRPDGSTPMILSTQSPMLLDYFQPEDVLVADRIDGGTQFTRLDSARLATWLENYSLGQLWEKNELGGRPAVEEAHG